MTTLENRPAARGAVQGTSTAGVCGRRATCVAEQRT
jgi:hypothetical protein